jgi:hypothetical protein
MMIRKILWCSCLSVVLAACAGSKHKVETAPSGVGLKTELLEAGAEPREKLRYQRAPGLTEALVIRLGLASLVQTSQADAALQAPVLTLGLTMGATNEIEKGVWRYPFAFRVIGIQTPDGSSAVLDEATAKELAPIASVTGAFEVDDRGITRKADVVVPPDASPRLLALLGNIRTSLISVPLPEDAVGVGARWKVTRLHSVGQIQTTQEVTYALLEKKDRLLRFAVTLTQNASPQHVKFDDQTTLDVESYQVSATGSLLMSLDGITPLSETRGTSDLRATLRHGDKSEPVAMMGSVDVVTAPLASGSAEPAQPANATP